MLLLGDIVRRHARTRAEHPAYVVGDARVTYAELHAGSNRIARALRRFGVGRGDRVGVLANNCAAYPLLYFAVVKLGAIVVPVNARFTAGEVAFVLTHAGAATAVVAAEFAPLIAGLRAGGGLPALRNVIGIEPAADVPMTLDDITAAESPDDVDADLDERDPHVMLYTSGTTGSPKGTLLSHRSYVLQAMTSHLITGLTEDDVGLSMFPMFHMGGWALPLGFWHHGCTVVIMPRAEPRAMLAAIAAERVTYVYAVPTVFAAMLAVPDFDAFDLESLRIVASGTAAMTAAQVAAIRTRFPRARMYVFYGSTEAGPVSALGPGDIGRKPETVGRGYLGVDVRLLADDGSEVARGQSGEIAVRSEFAMLGYWRNPEETARATADGWVRTGDLGAVDDDGFLSIVGRRKEVIRSAGESIYPVEIERVLAAHPAIAEAAVVGVPDPQWGEAVAAAVVVRPGALLTVAEVVDHVRAHLAGFKKPRHVVFVHTLPRTAASRQVHKPLLREQILERLARE